MMIVELRAGADKKGFQTGDNAISFVAGVCRMRYLQRYWNDQNMDHMKARLQGHMLNEHSRLFPILCINQFTKLGFFKSKILLLFNRINDGHH